MFFPFFQGKADGTCCGGGLNCADLLPYDGLSGTADFDMDVTPDGGEDACCDEPFDGIAGAPVDWTASGGSALGLYSSENPDLGGTPISLCAPTDRTYSRTVTFECLGDGTFHVSLSVRVYAPVVGEICLIDWGANFSEPFEFGTPYTLPLDANTCGGLVPCGFSTGWTFGDATVTFYEPS